MMLDVLLLLAAAVALQPDNSSSESSGDFKIITGLTPNKAICNSAISQHVQFGEVMRRSGSILGRCVLVRGHLFGRAIFASAAKANIAHARPSDGRKQSRIGLYGIAPDRLPEPGPYVVIGQLQDCAKFFADENAMVLGYCHTHHGPFLIVSELRPSR
jgi:hypothetical protein